MLLEVREGEAAALRIHPGVICDGLHARITEPLRPALHRAAGAGINQLGSTGRRQRLQHLGHRVRRTPAHRIGEVVAPGGAHLNQRPPQLQQPNQIGPHPRSRSGAEGHQGHPRAEAPQLPQAPVIRPEIVAPGTDAVGFINGHTHQLALVVDVFQQLPGGLHLQPLRRQIDQPQAIAAHPLDQIAPPGWIQAAMQAGRRDAPPLQVQHLVLHQGHQR